jgi:hypothetical protein
VAPQRETIYVRLSDFDHRHFGYPRFLCILCLLQPAGRRRTLLVPALHPFGGYAECTRDLQAGLVHYSRCFSFGVSWHYDRRRSNSALGIDAKRRITIACNGAGGRVGFEINAYRAGPLMRVVEAVE